MGDIEMKIRGACQSLREKVTPKGSIISNLLRGRKEGGKCAPLSIRSFAERWSRDNRFKKHSYVEVIFVMVILFVLIDIVFSII